ncbi:elongation factor 1-beta-like [Halichondria panicea]|uniref:elongation factor 1-beta-like n=1 Tax=Halichondria panicea TaxID=6063 RepID=UPI00312BCB24
MGFGDLKTDGGLQGLNDFLADKSYVDGWVPSQADVAVFEAMGNAPGGKFINALRWFNQINSYSSDERLTWPGVMKPVGEYGPSGSGASKPGAKDDDDDFDLFGSDESEDEAEAERVKQQRLSEYAEKKSKKKVIIAKSNIILDVKPWDDETDMGVIEAKVRTIEADGLLWGASKLVPLAYGIKKLQISCVVEDDKIGTDFLEESITAFEDVVQSVDIAAFNKV